MLNSFLSKASRETNESKEEQEGRIEDSIASSTERAKLVNKEATVTYPSPGSSPYHLVDEDDAPVLVARSPSTAQVPHVVDGSLTYDNLQTMSDVTDGANDGDDKKGNHDSAKKMDGFTSESVDTAKEVDCSGLKDIPHSKRLFSDSVIVETVSEDEEAEDPLMLSLNASDLDISAIHDVNLTTPSNVINEDNKDMVSETKAADKQSDKKTSDLRVETVAQNAKPRKSENETIHPEFKQTLKSMMEENKQVLPLLLGFLGCSAVLCARHLSTAAAGVFKENHSSAAESTAVSVDFANTLPDVLDEGEVIVSVNATNIITENPTTQEGPELPDTSIRISVAVVTDDTPTIKSVETDQVSQEFPSLKEDDVSSCHGSHWSGSMNMPQLFLVVMLVLATTSMFRGKRSKAGHSIKKECPEVKPELEGYDLSKYFEDHTVAQLREMLRARNCSTEGKKHKLVQRLAAVYKAELESLTVVKLRKILKSKNYTQCGTKAVIIRVLVEEGP